MRVAVVDVLLFVLAAVEIYHVPRPGNDNNGGRYIHKWRNPMMSPEGLRARFLTEHPSAKDSPRVTGAFFPTIKRCRPGAIVMTDETELGTSAKNYQDVRKHYSPGTLTLCCACPHRKMIGLVVLDKREGPSALLNTILSHFALLPFFRIYDFGCGALRSALGKLHFLLSSVVFVSDLFHIVNHLCSDALHPQTYTGLDGASSVAHEQRNSPINLMRRSLLACGQ